MDTFFKFLIAVGFQINNKLIIHFDTYNFIQIVASANLKFLAKLYPKTPFKMNLKWNLIYVKNMIDFLATAY
jgi:hypothetical protein